MTNFYDELEKLEKLDSSGGGMVCQGRLVVGFKVFQKDATQEDTFFEIDDTSDDTKQVAAHKKAEAHISANGVVNKNGDPARPVIVAGIIVKKESVLNSRFPINDDRYYLYPISGTGTFTAAWKTIMRPSIQQYKQAPGSYWMRIGNTKDPGGREYTDKLTGETRESTVAYVMKLYKDRTEAEEDCAGEKETILPTSSPVPEGWNESALKKMVPDIIAEVVGGKSMGQVAKDYGVTVRDVQAVIG